MVARDAFLVLTVVVATTRAGRTLTLAAPPSAVTYCASTGPSSVGQLAYAMSLGTSSDTAWANRRTLFKVSKVSASQIYVVSTDSICALAVTAFNAFFHGSPPTTRAFVIRFGSYYWVDDPDLSTGNDGRPWLLFTNKWVKVLAVGT